MSYVTPATVKAWLQEDAAIIFLDVRMPVEFAAAHLPGAISIYYAEVTSLADQLSGDQPIVVYCTHSTYRAPMAAKILMEVGQKNVHVLEGGIVAWQAGGLEIRTENLAQGPKILPPPDCICRERETS